MAKTMRAAVVREFGKPLTIEEVPVPEPRGGEILVKVHKDQKSNLSKGSPYEFRNIYHHQSGHRRTD